MFLHADIQPWSGVLTQNLQYAALAGSTPSDQPRDVPTLQFNLNILKINVRLFAFGGCINLAKTTNMRMSLLRVIRWQIESRIQDKVRPLYQSRFSPKFQCSFRIEEGQWLVDQRVMMGVSRLQSHLENYVYRPSECMRKTVAEHISTLQK
jgi:hypothetical protein